MKYLDAGHPMKDLKMDNQFNTPDILSYLNSMHILYTFAPPHEHEFIDKVERMNRPRQSYLCVKDIYHQIKKCGNLPHQM